MPVPKFDAVAYLAELDPQQQYITNQLSGGLVNLTYRACKVGSQTKHASKFPASRFLTYDTIILKHALPYVAAVGEHATLNLRRQSVEAEALQLLRTGSLYNIDEQGSSGLIQQQKDFNSHMYTSDEVNKLMMVEIPKLLYYDHGHHVLVLEDLGRLPSLSDVFSLFGGWVGETQPSSGISCAQLFAEVHSNNEMAVNMVRRFTSFGAALGAFFSKLHNNKSAQDLLEQYSSIFENEELKKSIQQYAIKPVAGLLKQFPQFLSNENEADILVNWALLEAQRSIPKEEVSFILGDCWSGSVLLNAASTVNNVWESKEDIAVIDWEFSGFGKGPHGDMAQLLAHLEMLRLSSAQVGVSGAFDMARQCLNAITNSLITEYAAANTFNEQSTNNAQPSSKHSVAIQYMPTAHQRPSPSDVQAMMMRASFLAHGIERINCAFWKQWHCFSANCGHKSGTVLPHECVLVQKIVQSGLWFLRHACEDVVAFCSEDNWCAITAHEQQRASAGERWLLDLF